MPLASDRLNKSSNRWRAAGVQRPWRAEPGSVMSIYDLTKATVIFGGVAFLIYSFPLVSQILTIGLLCLLWLSYAYRAIVNVRRKSGA
jgi:hypothetical protein